MKAEEIANEILWLSLMETDALKEAEQLIKSYANARVQEVLDDIKKEIESNYHLAISGEHPENENIDDVMYINKYEIDRVFQPIKDNE